MSGRCINIQFTSNDVRGLLTFVVTSPNLHFCYLKFFYKYLNNYDLQGIITIIVVVIYIITIVM